jgi:hypothetical protein
MIPNIFHTFEELVYFAKLQGATHLTMNNYHEGAFWIYKKPIFREMPEWEEEIFAEIAGKNWRTRKRLTHLAWFNDSQSDYHDWRMTEFIESYGDPKKPDSRFVKIKDAVNWYHGWNKYYNEFILKP